MNCPHCNVHIDEHPASRCLDEWIAEKIFHYHRPPLLRKAIPHYTTSIASAFEVVEKFRRLHPVIELRVSDWVPIPEGDCSAMIFNSSGKKVMSYAPEMPLAICRAAIKATQG